MSALSHFTFLVSAVLVKKTIANSHNFGEDLNKYMWTNPAHCYIESI